MANKKSETTQKPAEDLQSIEDLASGIDPAIAAGVSVMMGWGAGKKVSKTAFDAAVKSFCNAPAGNSKGGKK